MCCRGLIKKDIAWKGNRQRRRRRTSKSNKAQNGNINHEHDEPKELQGFGNGVHGAPEVYLPPTIESELLIMRHQIPSDGRPMELPVLRDQQRGSSAPI